MDHLQTVQILPDIPKPLSFLEALSRNMWWCWHYEAVELFRRIDPPLWDWSARNPIRFLSYVPQKRLAELAEDQSFLAQMQRVRDKYDELVCGRTGEFGFSFETRRVIAYFSMEFGIHESIPLFAGGLGVLAGDHLKSASDLELPLLGVGLLYRQGYFRQYLDQEGWQQEEYPETDIYQLPAERALDPNGDEVRVSVTGPDGEIHAAVWRINVGCVPLFLLDTNLPENSQQSREITSKLYIGESHMRVAQEMVLGLGGMRALRAMGLEPAVCHMNEGHSAFSALERLAQIMEKYQVDLQTALEIVPRSTIFTTHTPVAAGNEEFAQDLIRPYLEPLEGRLGISAKEILSLGVPPEAGADGPVSMFILGSRFARYCNGVSELHGHVAREMWHRVWPGKPREEVPITHVTNGVHVSSFLSHENSQLMDRYVGPDWRRHPSNPENVGRIEDIYDEELWRGRTMSRARLIRTCRQLMAKQYKRRNAPRDVLREAELVLDQDILTIAFARRFAAYKRANLLLHDPERFEAMLTSTTQPIQFIFAGKAHPRDHEGKELIKRLVRFARNPAIRRRVVFLEDYDIHIARHMVQGADVWLNTPRRPFEACGTSGMKAAINGVLNVSILDGWWCEGYAEDRGWKIGNGEEYSDPAYQDAVESQALYNVLENDVIPTFYDRRDGDFPQHWVRMMKNSMKMGMETFCSHRMVAEYDERFYEPARERIAELLADGAAEARAMAERRRRLTDLWHEVRLERPQLQSEGPFRVGEKLRATAEVHLGELRPDDVVVELYMGVLKSVDALGNAHAYEMRMVEPHGGGGYLYACEVECERSGRYGFSARITPQGDAWTRNIPGLITWA